MQASWLRKQSGQAVVVVAVAILVLTAILMLALDGGGIYLDKRQLQNAADAAALAGAEKLMAVNPSYGAMHDQAVGNLVQNLPGTSLPGSCNPCPNQKTIGAAGGNGVGTLNLGGGYWAELTVLTSYTYRVSVWHVHQDVLAALHGFQPTITIPARATAQNADLPYAIVLLQDKSQYATYSNFNINGTPGSVTLLGGGGLTDRGGIFSNASIAPGNDSPSIIFGPPNGCCGDLWAVHESATDLTALQSPNRVQGVGTSPPPQTGTHLDYPNYPEPVAPSTTYNGSTVLTGSITVLCPGTYSNQIVVQNGSTAILYPGVYRVQFNGVSVQGSLRTWQTGDPIMNNCPGLPTLGNGPAFDPGAIIEVTPADNGNSQCNKHLFSAGANSTIMLQPSPKYFNISLYIETMTNWQNVCTTQPLGTNVVKFSGGACYSIQGAIYGPADNMFLTGSGCGTGVGQIVAWTLTISGNGNVNETYSPSAVPYMKGLVQ
ncbi:MAG TPA: pilus assembly protein TadG-related protein [Candidatus Dormibacteraeota bacterium]|nr:pilus assembly protein TadG-related protein [Candidatus Dormibacteraeota bacterium]